MSSSLGPQLIPLLPHTLPPVLERVGEEGGGVMVRVSAVMSLGVIVQTLPKFLSSYSASIVEKVREIMNWGGSGQYQTLININAFRELKLLWSNSVSILWLYLYICFSYAGLERRQQQQEEAKKEWSYHQWLLRPGSLIRYSINRGGDLMDVASLRKLTSI